MTTMARLDDMLAVIDDHLDQADAQTITEALERGQAPDHVDVDTSCPWCGCGFHGLKCHRPADYVGTFSFTEDIDDFALTITDPAGSDCRCDSALPRLDDTWRPVIQEPVVREYLELMDETGLDGWAAQLELTARRRDRYEAQLRARREAHERQRRENRNRMLCRHMDATGLDGWAALADLEVIRPGVVWSDVATVAQAIIEVTGGWITQFAEAIVRPRRNGRRIEIGAAGGAVFFAPPGTPPPTDRNALPLADWERALVELPPEAESEAVPETVPETAAARALRLQQTRNTGPARPPAGRARRPRRHAG